jgi:hypothetical protein
MTMSEPNTELAKRLQKLRKLLVREGSRPEGGPSLEDAILGWVAFEIQRYIEIKAGKEHGFIVQSGNYFKLGGGPGALLTVNVTLAMWQPGHESILDKPVQPVIIELQAQVTEVCGRAYADDSNPPRLVSLKLWADHRGGWVHFAIGTVSKADQMDGKSWYSIQTASTVPSCTY